MLHRERELVGASILSTAVSSNHAAALAQAWRRWTASVHVDRLAESHALRLHEDAEHSRHLQERDRYDRTDRQRRKLATAGRVVRTWLHRRLGAAFRRWHHTTDATVQAVAERNLGTRLAAAALARFAGRLLARGFHHWVVAVRRGDRVRVGLARVVRLVGRTETHALRRRLAQWRETAQAAAQQQLQAEEDERAAEERAQVREAAAAEAAQAAHAAQETALQHAAARAEQLRRHRVERVVWLLDRRCRLDVQHALFRLRANVAAQKALLQSRSRAAKRCALAMQRYRLDLQRSGFRQWAVRVQASRFSVDKRSAVLRWLMRVSTAASQEHLRSAMQRWREVARQEAGGEERRSAGARTALRCAARLTQRWQVSE
jgi:hypothetical protein